MDFDRHDRPVRSDFTEIHRGAWLLCFLIIVAICFTAWWEHHVWIAASLSFAAALMLTGRRDVGR